MIYLVSFLGLICGVITVSGRGADLNCTGNTTTCINNEVCRDVGCVCPSSHYGSKCEFKITNALIIVLLCILPPVSWLAVCWYGAHSKGASGLWPGSRERSSDEFEREAEEEVIEDHPPPTYDQSKNYDTAGTCEGVNVTIQGGPGSDDVEPPPSYQEWTRKAASLRNQEIGRGGIGLVTISDNLPVTSHHGPENVESEDQC
ncbi:uncharacterized protein LOC100887996 [Strongylocentrotus purpuratus]|uniref:EGF-like domain-containing protein n=1 Tax=Strongylocentrotus purpuratus TaxID=7668 RepID=A0A7M7PUS3_STRPU|nr:uncharacterized protein LOC100887996 [Strongylocentrotus purpuratus]XP_030856320.1 uncharacterized protein LOC100887996 [Strongylocentrotus purpuratus]|eukprot:XP_003724031.1 PREDICTED: uncharacterized protein LOC100887996 [Strongylocentrotus purpuratus]